MTDFFDPLRSQVYHFFFKFLFCSRLRHFDSFYWICGLVMVIKFYFFSFWFTFGMFTLFNACMHIGLHERRCFRDRVGVKTLSVLRDNINFDPIQYKNRFQIYMLKNVDLRQYSSHFLIEQWPLLQNPKQNHNVSWIICPLL